MTTRKPFKIHGADGKVIEIPPGEFYFNTKNRARRMMLNSLSSNARRVYAVLELASVGYQRELCVKQNSEKKIVPLRPRDVWRAAKITPREFRLGMAELEREGLGKREASPEKGFLHGHVRLYSWAVPRPAQKVAHEEARFLIPSWFPVADKTLLTLAKHLKLKLLPDLDEEARLRVLVELDEGARSFEKARNTVVRALERVSAPRKKRAYKKTTETTDTTSVPASSSTSPEPAPTPEPDVDDVSPIVAAFGGKVTPSKCRRLRKDCGENITIAEIAAKAAERMTHYAGNKSVHNAPGLVIRELMEFFHHANDVAQWRREREEEAARQAAANRRAEERQRQVDDLTAKVDNPVSDAEARARLKRMTGAS